jgi:hypothetical protein
MGTGESVTGETFTGIACGAAAAALASCLHPERSTLKEAQTSSGSTRYEFEPLMSDKMFLPFDELPHPLFWPVVLPKIGRGQELQDARKFSAACT